MFHIFFVLCQGLFIITIIFIIIIIIILLFWQFFTPTLAYGFSPEIAWKQIPSILQDSYQYSGQS